MTAGSNAHRCALAIAVAIALLGNRSARAQENGLFTSAVVTSWIGWAGARTTFTAPQTWVGVISDKQCGGDHGGEVDERQCTMKCVHNGLKYVLVTGFGSKVWQIANQNFAELREHPGDTVKVSGVLKGDAIVISGMQKP